MTIRRFGLIGCGSVADFHIAALHGIEDACLTYVPSRDEKKARAIGEQESCEWTTDYRQLLRSPEVDIVCVTTSSGSHYRIGMDVLQAGKHLLLEKPIAMNSTEAATLARTAREQGLTMSVVSQRRFEAQHQAVKRVLDEGVIGKLLLVEMTLPFYRSQEYYDSAEWRGTLAEDGGVLMNQGIHSLDLLLWFAGEVESVFGKTATQTHQMEAEDLGLAIVQFKSGAFGTITASTSIRPGFPASLYLYGDKGTIKLEGSSIAHWEVPGMHEPKWDNEPAYGGVSDPRSIACDYHQSQMIDFMTAIDTGTEPLVTGEDGLRAVRLVEAIYKSSASGAQVKLS